MRALGLVLSAAGLFLLAQPVMAQESPVAACDRLAADPQVPIENIDPVLARPACEAAIQERPSEPRLMHQYARALEASGETEAARRLYEWLAADSHPPAQYALARILEAEMPGSADAARLFASAASGGYDPANPIPIPGATAAGVVDFTDIVAVVGQEPHALLSFVAQNIAPDAYAGAMRGAEGTLWARAGSPTDKALLLAALIRAADPQAEVRFASCTLADDTIDALVQALLLARPDRPRPLLEAAGQLAPLMERQEIRAMADGIGAIWTKAVATADRHAHAIAQRFAGAGFADAPVPLGLDALRADLASHHWIQIMTADGWTDLDPSLPGATVGVAPCVAAATRPQLDAAAMHRLKVEIVLEQREGESLVERTLLDVEAPTTNLDSGGLSVMFAETVGLELPEAAAEPPAGFYRFTPVIRLDGEDHIGEPFLLPEPLSAGAGIDDILGGFGDVLDVFGAPPEGPPAPEAAPAERQESNVTAAWLRVTTIAPDGGRGVASAPLFDRLGFVQRAQGTMPDSLIALAEVGGDYRDLLAVWDVALLDGRYNDGTGDANIPEGDELETLLAGLRAVHANYDLLRQALYEAVRGPDAPRFVRGRAGVSLLGWVPDEDNPALAGYLIDVLLDPAVPLADGRADAAAAAARAAGSVIAERLTVGSQGEILAVLGGPPAAASTPIDVAAVFDAAEGQGIAATTLTASAATHDAPVSAEAQARIAAHLSEGRVLIAPTAPVTLADAPALGWWMLDPMTGLIRDQMESGRHQGGEYAATTKPGRQAAPAYRRGVGERVFCVLNRARAVIGVLAVLSGDPTGEKVMKDAISLEQKIAEAADKTRRTGRSVADPPGGCGAGG